MGCLALPDAQGQELSQVAGHRAAELKTVGSDGVWGVGADSAVPSPEIPARDLCTDAP